MPIFTGAGAEKFQTRLNARKPVSSRRRNRPANRSCRLPHRRALPPPAWLERHRRPAPFGNGAPSGAFTYELPFPGQFFDQITKLHYNYYRDDPRTGRYIESDPILAGGINTYAYAGGNPVSYVDPLGLAKTGRWFGFTNRDFRWWVHNCYKKPGDPDIPSYEEMAEAYAQYQAAGSPPIGKCSNNPPSNACPAPKPADTNLFDD
jgi:RHS repeat-associated protein